MRRLFLGEDSFNAAASSSFGFLPPNLAKSAMSGSALFLKNVNDSWIAPQPQRPYNPAIPSIGQSELYACYSVDNCTYQGQPASIWYTLHEDVNCAAPIQSYGTGNMSLGECYQFPLYGQSYARLTCAGEHEMQVNVFYGNGCENHVLTHTTRSVCGPYTSKTDFCLGAAPSDPLPPSSHALSSKWANFKILLVGLFATSMVIF